MKGKFHGQGKYSFPDGAFYEGGWVDNKMHGKGIYIDTNHVQWEGDFYNGSFDSGGGKYISLRPNVLSLP